MTRALLYTLLWFLAVAAFAVFGALRCSASRIDIYTDTRTSDPSCAAGTPSIWYRSDTNVWKKCENGSISNLDTGGGGGTTLSIDGVSVGAAINFDDGGDINFTNDGDGTVSTAIKADAVALTTDTTGNYVASVATTAPLSGGAAGSEGAALTLTTSMSTDRLLGRDTASTGVAEEIALAGSLVFTGSTSIQLSGDSATPGNSMLYGTNGSGTKGWYAQPSGASNTLEYHVEGFTNCCGTTEYMGLGSNNANCNATIGNVDIVHSGPTITVGNLKCRQKTDSTCTVTFTIMKNGSASAASTCTSTNAASCAASTVTDTIANGDTWAIRENDDASTCTANCEESCTFTATY